MRIVKSIGYGMIFAEAIAVFVLFVGMGLWGRVYVQEPNIYIWSVEILLTFFNILFVLYIMKGSVK